MHGFLEKYSVTTIVVFIVGAVLFATMMPVILFQISAEHQEIEKGAERQAAAALDMLQSVHTSAMVLRKQTTDNDPAIDTLNMSMEQFSRENQKVRLWLVMAQSVIDYQRANNQNEIEGPQDDVDSRALKERKPQLVLSQNGTLLRYTRPVLLGVGSATDPKCAGCHTGLMNIARGEVIGAYSAEVNMAASVGAWRINAAKILLAGIAVIVVTLCLIVFLIRLTVLNPVRNLANAADQIASGEFDVEFSGENRPDFIGSLACSLNLFKQKMREQFDLEVNILEESLSKEKELNEQQRRFVTMASHEFRTPLAIIDGTAQRLKSKADKNRLTPEDAVHRVEKIRGAVQRMTRLMESTLTSARMEDGKIAVEIGPCDVKGIMKKVCTLQQELATDHFIEYDLEALPETIQADIGALEQVFTNLLSNAVKYSPDAPHIEVKAWTENQQAVICVCDHGLGIDKDDLPRMFERFFRAKTSAGIVGTGIGLNLLKNLVDMHGGSIKVDSRAGEGSEFTVTLPIAGPDRTVLRDTRAA